MNSRRLIALLVCVSYGLAGTSQQTPPPSVADLSRDVLALHWIAYAPTNYDPDSRPPRLPSAASIRADLTVLRRAGFEGLVTYSASLPDIVEIAALIGFQSVLLGVWDPANADEMRAAEDSAKHGIVIGLICGNEGLMFRRYTPSALMNGMNALRAATGKPVSTTEVIESFYTKPELVDWSDFLTVNAHPFFHGRRVPADAVDWTVASWRRLREHVADKPILFKEVGLPSAGQTGLNESVQEEYYSSLLQTEVRFVFFEAFDAMFKRGAVEQSWGLFRADRSPKSAAAVLATAGR